MDRRTVLQQIHDEIASCTKCELYKTRTNAVPGEGPVNATVMFIGEAPGAVEDRTGLPFVGRSGELLTELIQDLGLSRDDVFITSVLKSRPPGNRPPRKGEINACISYLDRQIEVIHPQIIVLLGSVAVSSVIGPWRMSEAHGRFHEANGRTYFITYHPAAALRFPTTLDVMRGDFKKLKNELN
jgi:uracil-DNA glycosylase family 4